MADDVLEPIKAAGSWGTLPLNLKETCPSLQGTWVFRDPNENRKPPPPAVHKVGRPTPLQQAPLSAEDSTPSSLIVVQVDWTDDGDGSYDKTATRFYRLDPGKGGPGLNMDINLLELGEYVGCPVHHFRQADDD